MKQVVTSGVQIVKDNFATCQQNLNEENVNANK